MTHRHRGCSASGLETCEWAGQVVDVSEKVDSSILILLESIRMGNKLFVKTV